MKKNELELITNLLFCWEKLTINQRNIERTDIVSVNFSDTWRCSTKMTREQVPEIWEKQLLAIQYKKRNIEQKLAKYNMIPDEKDIRGSYTTANESDYFDIDKLMEIDNESKL